MLLIGTLPILADSRFPRIESSRKLTGLLPSGSKVKGAWPFAGSGAGGDLGSEGQEEQAVARLKGTRKPTPFIFTRRSSLYYDEDGDLAHEFYEETVVTKDGRKRSKLKRIQKNLIPQGIVKLNHPQIHVDFPVILCEFPTLLSLPGGA
ncbi:hypothetical protein DPEC_G00204860 [Dallia pectoralis]|uniref:Uncharacterized protein n=1 Tax=Dallia pectoralis TaxID=75939 RepID=A0ACC2G4F8_DALPE|nr:hypothetical protein DPEC_G00204860 [Dallia pectoralis]